MKTIFRTTALTLIFSVISAFTFATGEIRGLITDETGTPAIGAIIKVLAGEHEVTGTTSDIDGKYSIKPIQAGKYDILISYPQYRVQRIKGVVVNDEEASYVDVELKTFGLDSAVEVVGVYQKSLVDPRTTSMQTIGADEMAHIATPRGDIKTALVAKSSDVYQDPNDGMLYVRGARKDATQYFVDGEKVIGGMEVPATAIESATIITGGIPAQYGDLTGGVVIITTKDYFSGMRSKNMWIRDRVERKEQEAMEQKKKADAEKRAKEIEEEKKKLKEEKEKKLQEEKEKGGN